MMSDFFASMDDISTETVRRHRRTLSAALSWARDQDLIQYTPRVPKVPGRAKRSSKGRPLADEEIAIFREHAGEWLDVVDCLWLSGLRLGEAIRLSWDDPKLIRVDLDRKVMCIPDSMEKSRKGSLVPIVPEFRDWLVEREGVGRVLVLPRQRQSKTEHDQDVNFASKALTSVGEASGVIVSETGKYASAHDLRRSFGLKWARLVAPKVLMTLMRHDSINTTMKYYVGEDVQGAIEAVGRAQS